MCECPAVAVTYYVALPFESYEDPAPAEATECQIPAQAIHRLPEAMAHHPKYVGAVAFSRTGDAARGMPRG